MFKRKVHEVVKGRCVKVSKTRKTATEISRSFLRSKDTPEFRVAPFFEKLPIHTHAQTLLIKSD